VHQVLLFLLQITRRLKAEFNILKCLLFDRTYIQWHYCVRM